MAVNERDGAKRGCSIKRVFGRFRSYWYNLDSTSGIVRYVVSEEDAKKLRNGQPYRFRLSD